MSQIRGEITNLVKILMDSEPIVNVIEIGTKLGGTLHIWKSLAAGKIISIDMPNGTYGGWLLKNHPYLNDVFETRNKFFSDKRTFMITGDSHKPSTKAQVKKILGKDKADLLFIDGDHTYKGVKKDYNDYKGFVRRGGMIVFHDIYNCEYHNLLGVGAWKVWDEVKGIKREFIHNSKWGYGIGLLQKWN